MPPPSFPTSCLGIDLTYDDMSHRGKVEIADYRFTAATAGDWVGQWVVTGEPRDTQTAEELGYSRGQWTVDTASNHIIKSVYWDNQRVKLKTVTYNAVEPVEGIWTTHEITVNNHNTGHHIRLELKNVAYGTEFDDDRIASHGLDKSADW